MNTKIVYIDDVAISVELAKRRMTKKQLSDLTGINQGSISTMMRRGTVRPKTAGLIAGALGCDVSMITKLPENMEVLRDNGQGR